MIQKIALCGCKRTMLFFVMQNRRKPVKQLCARRYRLQERSSPHAVHVFKAESSASKRFWSPLV